MKKKQKKTIKHRIPYEAWINSQLSIARHYGGCKLNGKNYELDFQKCEKRIVDGKIKYFPDLITYDP